MTEAGCWAHARRKFFDLADLGRAPLALKALRRIRMMFATERDLTGLPAAERLTHRQKRSLLVLADLEAWMRQPRAKLSRHADAAKAMGYLLNRWESFIRFLGEGRIDLSNSAAARALCGIAIGSKFWLFAVSDRVDERAAAIYSLITTAKLSDVDPRAWLADVMARINDHPAARLVDLLPLNGMAARAHKPRPDHIAWVPAGSILLSSAPMGLGSHAAAKIDPR